MGDDHVREILVELVVLEGEMRPWRKPARRRKQEASGQLKRTFAFVATAPAEGPFRQMNLRKARR